LILLFTTRSRGAAAASHRIGDPKKHVLCSAVQSISEDDIGGTLRKAAMAVISKTGGASGPLYGTFLMDAGKAAPDGHLTLSDWATMMRAGLEGVQKRGKAKTGEKTMVDALIPAVEALDESVSGGGSWAEALVSAADAAEDGMHATTPLVATKGRASYLGERSKGHQDPGETSTYHLFATALDAETNEGT